MHSIEVILMVICVRGLDWTKV
uniref:Uncharacterized protein n=1 Tax=Anguilla anguilla TaxID=7936 RepID=A0A0E9P706_ANGAN